MIRVRHARRGRLSIAALALAATACTDAATRVAYDIESGTGKLASYVGDDVSSAVRGSA